jgi:hypothetical protein
MKLGSTRITSVRGETLEITIGKWPTNAVALCIGLLAVNALLFALELSINDLAVPTQHGIPLVMPFTTGSNAIGLPEMRQLPYPAITHWLNPAEKFHVALIVLAALQTAVLYALWRGFQTPLKMPIVRVALALTVVFMIWRSLTAATVSSLDMYAYVGYAKLGLAHAYAPTGELLRGSFSSVNGIWGRPMIPCYYGPLWLLLEQFVTAPATSLGAAIFFTRIFGLASLIVLAFALDRCRVPAFAARAGGGSPRALRAVCRQRTQRSARRRPRHAGRRIRGVGAARRRREPPQRSRHA